MKNIVLPELGEGIEEVVVSLWHFKEGDTVKPEDDVVEIVTDKATFNVPAGTHGKIKRIVRGDGAAVKIGDILAEME